MNKSLVTIALAGLWNITAYAESAPDFSALFEQTKDSVVSVEVEATVPRNTYQQQIPPGFPPELFEHFFGRPMPYGDEPPQRRQSGQGSGFIIDGDGYILTNAHVVEGADKVTVQLIDRHEYDAEVIGVDQRTDVALLKIDGQDLPVAVLGNSDDVKVGDWVLAIGSPFGFTHTATKGIVSAVSRSLPNGAYVPFIQTDAAVNPGNSGGPLFNSKGEVIGINSQIYSRSGAFNGLAFSIPINVAKNVADQLKEGGEVSRGWLGVSIQGIDQALAKSFGMDHPQGALVTGIMPDSPAKAAGLKPGDVVLSYNGKQINKSSDLPPMVAMTQIGDEADLEVLRNGKNESITVTIGNLESMSTEAATSAKTILGLSLRNLEENERKELGLEDQGVLVSSVKRDSAADEAGLRANDILLAVGSRAVDSVKAASNALQDAEKRGGVALLIRRGEQTVYLPLDIQ